ncbi:nitroreductase family protein [Candidatus Woesearchaeota archaeon]|nr:nitroreductase family protein [Candidatus Woesearchaeota archaeon]
MDTLECLMSRRSIRKFLDIPVEFEKVGNIIDAGRMAPSAGNLQDTKFVLVTDSGARQELGKACVEQYWVGSAPVIIVICSDVTRTKRFYGEVGEKFSTQNAAACVENMLLAAHAQGLASCWVGAFEDEMVRRTLGVPDHILIQAIVPFGYPDEKVPVPQRLTMDQCVFLGSYGNRIKDLASYMEWYGEHITKAVKKGQELVKEFARRIQQ